MKRLVVMAIVLIVALIVVAIRPGAATITIDPNQTFQTMTGWEMASDLDMNPTRPVWAEYNDKVIALAASIGINRVRMEITPAVEGRNGFIRDFINGKATPGYVKARYQANNDNDDPFVINPAAFDFAELDWQMRESTLPLIAEQAARGEKVWISLCYVSFRDGRMFQMEPEEYAELILAVFQHMQATYGLVPDSVEMILEPDNSHGAWRGADIGKAMVATAKRLVANGFKQPDFVAPSVMDLRSLPGYLDEMLAVPGVVGVLKEVSYHRYGGTLTREMTQRAQSIGARMAMLELWFGLATYEVLFEDLRVGDASAWQGRVMHYFYDVSKDGKNDLTLFDDVRYNAQVFRAARLGAVRIGVSGEVPRQVEAVSFRNPGGQVSVVIKAQRARYVTVQGLPAGTYQLSFAIGSGSGTQPDVVVEEGAPLKVLMPGKGLFSIIGQ